MKKFAAVVFTLLALTLSARASGREIDVHFFPHILDAGDLLQIGPEGRALHIPEPTLLVWVDLFPDMFFAHKTAYILISRNRIRIRRGDWWPVLNGKTILHNEKGNHALVSPFELPGKHAKEERIVVHVYPHELSSQDRLTDGPLEKLYTLYDNCLLIWVDLLPDAFFAHPTAYIVISKQNVRVEHGNWWPELNGKKILYGQRNRVGVVSPFKVLY